MPSLSEDGFLAGRRQRLGLGRQEGEDELRRRTLAFDIDPHGAAAIGELAEQHLLGQRLLEMLLDDARERTGAEQAVVALLGQPAASAVAELDEDLAVGKLDLELGHELV